jgi:hypothetical protein
MSARTSATMLGYQADAYTGVAVSSRTDYGALASTVGSGAAAGTELSGGTYARLAITPSGSGASRTWTQTFNVPSGATVAEYDKYSAVTAGTYLDAVATTSQTFASAGTYQVSATFTES